MRKRIASATTWGLTDGCEEIDICIGDANIVDMIGEYLEEKAITAVKNADYDLAKELINELIDLQCAAFIAFAAKPDESAESKEETEGAEE